MRLVVDTNVLFSFFKKESFTRQLIILNKSTELISPQISLNELGKYASEILAKSKLTKNGLQKAMLSLHSYVTFVPENEYKAFLREACALANGFSAENSNEFMYDIDFFALALKEKCPIWSNDRLFKKQATVAIFSTEEMAKHFPNFKIPY